MPLITARCVCMRSWALLLLCGIAGTAAIGPELCPAQSSSGLHPLNNAKGRPQFEVVSIRPSKQDGSSWGCLPGGRIVGVQTLVGLIKLAYDVQTEQIEGVPEWGTNERFALSAIPPEASESAKIQFRTVYPSKEQQQMLRSMLEERFQLSFHRQVRKQPAYLLSLKKPVKYLSLNAPKDERSPSYVSVHIDDAAAGNESLVVLNSTMSRVAHELGTYAKLNVIDQTGLTGAYDFKVPFVYIRGEGADFGASVLSGLQDYGFKLQYAKAPIEQLVIDHVERPSEN